jgi:hypothetical protein
MIGKKFLMKARGFSVRQRGGRRVARSREWQRNRRKSALQLTNVIDGSFGEISFAEKSLLSLGAPVRQRMKQIPPRKQCKTEGSTPEIEIMASAGFEPPVHPGKQTKCFADMSKDDNHQTSRPDYLQERPYVFFLSE